MHRLRRLVTAPLLLGLVLGVVGFHAGAPTAAAQSNAVSISCSNWPGVCTILVNYPIGVGNSASVTLPDGSLLTLGCPNGCAAGAQYSITVPFSTYSTAQWISPTGAACSMYPYPYAYPYVNGYTYPAPFGCAPALVSVTPYVFTPTYVTPAYMTHTTYAPPPPPPLWPYNPTWSHPIWPQHPAWPQYPTPSHNPPHNPHPGHGPGDH